MKSISAAGVISLAAVLQVASSTGASAHNRAHLILPTGERIVVGSRKSVTLPTDLCTTYAPRRPTPTRSAPRTRPTRPTPSSSSSGARGRGVAIVVACRSRPCSHLVPRYLTAPRIYTPTTRETSSCSSSAALLSFKRPPPTRRQTNADAAVVTPAAPKTPHSDSGSSRRASHEAAQPLIGPGSIQAFDDPDVRLSANFDGVERWATHSLSRGSTP